MKDCKTPLLLCLLAIALITLFSCCSWIYPLQPHDDVNWFMAIGKSMLSGKLLYTDVHDQKGPLLFFIHEWAAALSSKTFIGIYLLEILCCFMFLVFSYKTMRMFAGHGISLITTCIVGILTYTTDFMCYGDTVEELSLPILLYILYKTLRYAKLNELPNIKESVIIGALMAAIFWTKFTLLAMCMGALVALCILAWQRREMNLGMAASRDESSVAMSGMGHSGIGNSNDRCFAVLHPARQHSGPLLFLFLLQHLQVRRCWQCWFA